VRPHAGNNCSGPNAIGSSGANRLTARTIATAVGIVAGDRRRARTGVGPATLCAVSNFIFRPKRSNIHCHMPDTCHCASLAKMPPAHKDDSYVPTPDTAQRGRRRHPHRMADRKRSRSRWSALDRVGHGFGSDASLLQSCASPNNASRRDDRACALRQCLSRVA